MRNPERIPEILDRIRKVWEQHPQLRLGQLLVASFQKKTKQNDIFYVEDKELIKKLTEYRLKKNS